MITTGIENREPFKLWQMFSIFVAWLVIFATVCFIIDKNLIKTSLCLCLFFGFSIWGHILVFPVYYVREKILHGIIWGTVLGIPLGALITSAIVYSMGWNLSLIFGIVTALPFFFLCFLFIKYRSRIKLKFTRGSEFTVLLIAMLIVTPFFTFPLEILEYWLMINMYMHGCSDTIFSIEWFI